MNENVITRAHDRWLPLRVRMFAKSNYTKKGFSKDDGKEPAAEWDTPKAVLGLQEALLNMGDVLHKLWPLDNTARRLERVLNHYSYGASLGGSERDRVKHMEDFCDLVLRENASRAIREREPLSFRQQKERWRDCAENFSPSNNYAQNNSGQSKKEEKNKYQDGTRSNTQASKPGGGGGSGGSHRPGFDSSRGRAVRFNGSPVCFHYNNRSGCSRALKDKNKPEEGCDDGRGGNYAHVCNYEMGGGRSCLAHHRRADNH